MRTNQSVFAAISVGIFICGGGCSGPAANPWQLLTCQHADEQEGTRKFCVRQTLNCNYPVSAIELCDLNWEDEDIEVAHLGDDDSCDGDNLVPPPEGDVTKGKWGGLGCDDPAWTASASGGSGQSSASASGSASASAGGTASTTEAPTTGGSTTEAPTTGGSTTGGSTTGGSTTGGSTTEGPAEQMYLCSLRTHEKCADLDPDNALGDKEVDWYDGAHPNLPNNTAWDVCWVKVNPKGGVGDETHNARCAKAADASAARIKCEANCNGRNTAIQGTCDETPGCEVDAPIQCDLNPNVDPDDTPVLASEYTHIYKCEPGGEILPVWGGQTELVLFDAQGTMLLSDGTSASVLGVVGHLGFELTNCTSTTCDLTIDALEGLSTNASGLFVDPASGAAPYSLHGFGFRAGNVITGQWDKVREIVTFSTGLVDARFWGDLLVFDGVELWPGSQSLEIDQIVGSLSDEEGPLTLNLAYNSPLGTVTLSLTTRAD